MTRGIAFFCLALTAAAAEPPQDIIKVFRTAAESLAEQDSGLFLEQFDPAMPGFAQLREDVESLMARGYVISTLEFDADAGDDSSRQVEVDWVWRLSGEAQRRVFLKCSLVKKGKIWKIVSLSPIGFLK